VLGLVSIWFDKPANLAAAMGMVTAVLAFAVQKHDATRLHYDFRLEWGGVLKSWAVTRGPSLDPADKRLAVEVEDHPLDYGDFEGVIPEGYGAGVVQLWDRGQWAPLRPDSVEQDLERGELKFVVAGERLRGGFVLVRLKPRAGEKPGRHNWLLIKERDSMATPGAGDAVLRDETSVKSGRSMAEIGAKPGRAGIWPPPGRGESDVGPRADRAHAAGKPATPADGPVKPASRAPSAKREPSAQPASPGPEPAPRRQGGTSQSQADARKPAAAAKPPAQKAGAGKPGATAARPKPNADTPRPASRATKPRPATPKTSADTPSPAGRATKPKPATPKASAEAARVASGATKPKPVTPKASAEASGPAGGATQPRAAPPKSNAAPTRAAMKPKSGAVAPSPPAAKSAPPHSTTETPASTEPSPAPKPRATPLRTAGPSRHAASAMPDFVQPQLCRLVTVPPAGADWLHELKLDGYRCQLRVQGHQAAIRTRTGLDWTGRFGSLGRLAAALPDGLADGEVVALDSGGQPSFAELQAVLAGESRAPLVFYLFDLLHDGREDLRPRPLTERKAALKAWLAGADAALRYLDDFRAPGDAVLASACELSMEGIVSKRAEAPYASGRGDGWTKSKCRGRDEFIIGGWTAEKSGHGLGALLMGAMRDGRLIHLGRVGTGFSARVAEMVLARLAPLRREASPFSGPQPPRAGAVTWVRPELVAEIAYGGWTGDGMLRHASFQGLREDKPAAEVAPPPTAEPPPPADGSPVAEPPPPAAKPPPPAAKSQPPGAKPLKNTPPGGAAQPPPREAPQPRAATPRPTPATALRLTHPEKILWPASDDGPAVTKADLAAYFQSHADAILASAGGRPLSVVRAPEGIGGQLFFQRHAMPGQSPLIGAVEMPGQRRPFLRIDDLPALLALAQMSVLELHPAGARADDPTIPDRLVFDLDPAEGLDFEAVIAGGRELKRRLEAIGLTPFPRITGGKGLHLVVPLAREGLGWPEAKQFARLVCVQLERDMPERFTTNMAKKLRTGRIFLDYLRNDQLSTAIASWSPRARPGAPVSRPVAWSAVKSGLVPNGTRLADVRDTPPPGRDPWAGFDAAAGSLREAIGAATAR